ICLFLPGRRRHPARGNDRRHRAHASAQAERSPPDHRRAGGAPSSDCNRNSQSEIGAGAAMIIGLGHYLSVAAIVFTLGVLGIFLNRKNVIIILMSIELILLSVNINLVAFSTFLGDIVGQVYAL